MSSTLDASETATEGEAAPAINVCAACGAEAKMACPQCVKLKQKEPAGFDGGGFGVVYFCTQDCFKANWSAHKKSHKPWAAAIDVATPLDPEEAKRPPDCFRGYGDYTGDLRPWAYPKDDTAARLRRLPASIARPDYSQTGQPTSEQMEKRNRAIRVYGPKDVAGIREACKIGRKVLDAAGRAVGLGVTTAEVDRVTYETTVEHGGYPSPLNYYDFPCSVCTSVNEVICHGIPDQRELQDGDVVNVDVTAILDGWYGDLNETYIVGKGTEETRHLVKSAYDCLHDAIAIVKPGTKFRELGGSSPSEPPRRASAWSSPTAATASGTCSTARRRSLIIFQTRPKAP